jgi:mannose-6-phosphate isomerase
MTNELCLDILGTSFTITVDEDEAYLQKVLAQYKEAVENTQAISGINDPLNISILTGYLLCDEINKIKQQLENESVEVQQRTMTLIAKIDQALGQPVMKKIYKLQNQIKHYEWGSHTLLPQFLGFENKSGRPHAEMWMGTNRGAPSKVYLSDQNKMVDLCEFSGELPFLFKLIAVETPLSIQVHPNKEQAEEGFREEEEAGLDLKSPARNYKDDNHKPEILCAISPFTLMAGFRKPEEIQISLEEFVSVIPQLKEIISPLIYSIKADLLYVFFRILYSYSGLELEYITNFVKEAKISGSASVIDAQQWNLMKDLAARYPSDISILSPLYLNLFTLQSGQAVYIPACLLHCYVSGFGVELMANSDNVLRCGLTPKYIDIPELMNVVNFNSYIPQVFSSDASSRFFYKTPCKEFSLGFFQGDGDIKIFTEKGNIIGLVTDGELHTKEYIFKKGESFFIHNNEEPLVFNGNYSLFTAVEGDSRTS